MESGHHIPSDSMVLHVLPLGDVVVVIFCFVVFLIGIGLDSVGLAVLGSSDGVGLGSLDGVVRVFGGLDGVAISTIIKITLIKIQINIVRKLKLT